MRANEEVIGIDTYRGVAFVANLFAVRNRADVVLVICAVRKTVMVHPANPHAPVAIGPKPSEPQPAPAIRLRDIMLEAVNASGFLKPAIGLSRQTTT